MKKFEVSRGSPLPYGNLHLSSGTNFSIFVKDATSVELCLLNENIPDSEVVFPLDRDINRTGDVWHILIKDLSSSFSYGYKINGNPEILLDPYAKAVNTSKNWVSSNPHVISSYKPLGVVKGHPSFDWGDDKHPNHELTDLIIYEMHVRGFTQDPSSKVDNPGKFLGIIEKIPHLLELGVNAIELLPVHEFNEGEYNAIDPLTQKRLCNYWGYSTVNFFSPMNRYVVNDPLNDFKVMVKALHQNGIEVILDVVFNHTAEGNELGPTHSYRGFANSIYYMIDPHGHYYNFSGCGNTFNCNHPVVRSLILECLRYWVTEMHVDGFRFDLASILRRDTDGSPLDKAPLSDLLSNDPVLSQTKLIAEPWDAVGLYHVGKFYEQEDRWSEWNGKYRDTVRRFIRGDSGKKGSFASKLCGSQDIYYRESPSSSINFITAHDGFTLADLVAYNQKHNFNNGEDNQDGSNQNDSWNCGFEGPTADKKIVELRDRQVRNFHLALMISLGVPMILMRDEYGHTKNGNNNTWCQDNSLNWFQWTKLEENRSFFEYYKKLIAFRKNHKILRRNQFLTTEDIIWHSAEAHPINWGGDDNLIAYTLIDHETQNHLYVAFSAQGSQVDLTIPQAPHAKQWKMIVDTAKKLDSNFVEEEKASLVSDKIILLPFSAILLKAI